VTASAEPLLEGHPHTSRELQVERRCPSCGGPIRHSEGDRVIGCSYCGIRLAVQTGREVTRYAIRAGGTPEGWIIEGKRLLRAAGRRLLELGDPVVLYVPYFRIHTETWFCQLADPPARAISESLREERRSGPVLPAEKEPEFTYRVGVADLTMDGNPTMNLGRRTLGFRTQVCAVVPLNELPPAEEASGPECGPGRLGAELADGEASRQLLKSLVAAEAEPPGTVRNQALFAPFPDFQRIYQPIVLLPYRGPEGQEAVLLDGVTGQAERVLGSEEYEGIQSRYEVAPGDRAGWKARDQKTPLIPLICPECSSPLPHLPRARAHGCENCGRFWVVSGAILSPIASVRLWSGSLEPAAKQTRFLPFYRITASGPVPAWYIPAFRGRHRRAIWNLALGLTRAQPDWTEDDTPLPTSTAVEMEPLQAPLLIPFLDLCLRGQDSPEWPRPRPGGAGGDGPAQLVWIALGRRGRELIEPSSGLGISESALQPWTTDSE
jgi:hypothetical protein